MRLIDCFIDVITYTSDFTAHSESESRSFEEIRNDYHELFGKSDEYRRDGKLPQADWDTARFAVCAWIDESVLCSLWEGKTQWTHRQLQREYYDTTSGGEEFFERLDALGPEEKDVREVYAYCLALGFQGRYFRKEDERRLVRIKASNLQYIKEHTMEGDLAQDRENLFPGAYSTPSGQARRTEPGRAISFFTLFSLVWPPVLFAVLFFIYHDILATYVAQFLGQ